MAGTLLGDHVIVRDPPEANRLHNKGHFGKPLSGGSLRLDLWEAIHLVELGRLQVHRDGQGMAWPELVAHAAATAPGFEILYLVYRDLRDRGYLVHAAAPPEAREGAHFRLWARGTDRPGAPTAWIRAVSERSPLVLSELTRFATRAREAQAAARLCVVDEESDLTYYELDHEPPHGPAHPAAAVEGAAAFLLADRVLVADPKAAATLHGTEFYGKPVATGLQLSLVESDYLTERGALRLVDAATGKVVSSAALRRRGRELEPLHELRLRVYRDLRERGLIVKTGFKFGTHFRAYESRPEEAHAPYLVQAVPHDFTSPWEPVARAIRLSHTVRKRFYLAAVRGEDVRYLAFDRFRP